MRQDLPLQLWESPTRRLPVVVSFFSGRFYAREAWELMRSCQAHGLDYEIVELPDMGDWLKNCNRKAEVLLDASVRHPRRSLLWLDADARVRRDPERLRWISEPVAYHRIRDEFPCDATVYFGHGRATREALLQEWIRLVAADPIGAKLPVNEAAVGAPAQFYFEHAVRNLKLDVCELGEEWCWIYDLAKDREGTNVLDPHLVPVIEQMQANRWAKLLAKVKP